MAEQRLPSDSPAVRRSVTLPLRFSERSPGGQGSNVSAPEPQETLFEHHSVRIVAFAAGQAVTSRPGSSQVDFEEEEDEAGTLPYSSRLERTIAVGSLRIYRAPGSVAFLNCGHVVQAILRKSRCWCVDDVSSKFVLQKRRPQYWRIEIPVTNEAERLKAQDFRDVLSQILRFETTVCPFQRTFTVALPEGHAIKYRPWRPAERPKPEPGSNLISDSVPEGEGVEGYYTAPADDREGGNGLKGDSEATDEWRPAERPNPEPEPNLTSDLVPEMDGKEGSYSAPADDSQGGNELNSDSDATDDTDATPRNLSSQSECDDTESASSSILDHGHPVTVAPQRTMITSPTSEGRKGSPPITGNSTMESASTAFPLALETGFSVTDSPQLAMAASTAPEGEEEGSPLTMSLMTKSAPTAFPPKWETDRSVTAASQLAVVNSPTSEEEKKGLPLTINSTMESPPTAFPQILKNGRSVTSPLQLTIVTSPTSEGGKGGSPLSRSSTVESAPTDLSSSVDSFHSVQSWHSPITPLPLSPPMSNPGSPTTYPYPHDNINLPKRPNHSRDISEITLAAETLPPRKSAHINHVGTKSDGYEGSSPTTPGTPALIEDIEDNLDEEQSEISTPPSAKKSIRHRPTTGSNSRRSELSPLPPAANLFSPPPRRRPRRSKSVCHLPTLIIQKTYEILVSPPSHLFHLMVDMASKIASGEWRDLMFVYEEEIVGHGDNDDREVISDGRGQEDYGIDLAGKSQMRRRTAQEGGSWEVD